MRRLTYSPLNIAERPEAFALRQFVAPLAEIKVICSLTVEPGTHNRIFLADIADNAQVHIIVVLIYINSWVFQTSWKHHDSFC